MKDYKKVILFGYSDNKKSIARFLTTKSNVIMIVDNDNKKIGKNVELGMEIQEVERIEDYKMETEVHIVITSELYYDEMLQQVTDLGWSKERINSRKDLEEVKNSFEYKCFVNDVRLELPTPTVINLELSGYCNCQCIYCPFHGEINMKKNHKGFMDESTIDKVIELINRIPTIDTIDTTGPGEIFINKNWYELLQKVLDNCCVETVYIYTNGMMLNEENIQKLCKLHVKNLNLEISIDGTSKAENNKYRVGSDFDVIKKNIYMAKRNFEKEQKGTILITNCYPVSLKKIEDANGYLDSKENVQIPRYLEDEFPDISKVSQNTFYYGEDRLNLSIFDKRKVKWRNTENRCLNLFNRIAIDFQGNLLKCSCGHAGIVPIANIFQDDVYKIWRENAEMQQARNHFIKNIEEEDFCKGCPGRGIGEYYVLINKESI